MRLVCSRELSVQPHRQRGSLYGWDSRLISLSLTHCVNINMKWMGLEEGKVLRDALLMEKGSDASGHYRGVYTMHLHTRAHTAAVSVRTLRKGFNLFGFWISNRLAPSGHERRRVPQCSLSNRSSVSQLCWTSRFYFTHTCTIWVGFYCDTHTITPAALIVTWMWRNWWVDLVECVSDAAADSLEH